MDIFRALFDDLHFVIRTLLPPVTAFVLLGPCGLTPNRFIDYVVVRGTSWGGWIPLMAVLALLGVLGNAVHRTLVYPALFRFLVWVHWPSGTQHSGVAWCVVVILGLLLGAPFLVLDRLDEIVLFVLPFPVLGLLSLCSTEARNVEEVHFMEKYWHLTSEADGASARSRGLHSLSSQAHYLYMTSLMVYAVWWLTRLVSSQWGLPDRDFGIKSLPVALILLGTLLAGLHLDSRIMGIVTRMRW